MARGRRGGRRGRGRGRGRDRGVRGGGGGAAQLAPGAAADLDLPGLDKLDARVGDDEAKEEEVVVVYTKKSIRSELFLKEAKVGAHVAAIEQNADLYIGELHTMIERKVSLTFSVATKARILAAMFIAKKRDEADRLLALPTFSSLAEIVKCVQILDAPRRARQLKRRLESLEKRKVANDKAVKSKTLSDLRTRIHNLSLEPHSGSFSGAMQRKIRKWVGTIPKNQLEFFLLNYPTDSWRALADIIHVKRSDFKLAYFQGACFGEEEPKDSLVKDCRTLTKHTLEPLLRKHKDLALCYSYIRRQCRDNSDEKKQADERIKQVMAMGFTKHQAQEALARVPHYGDRVNLAVEYIMDNGPAIDQAPRRAEDEDEISKKAKAMLAKSCPLETLIWWYHELRSRDSENIIRDRLQSGESISPGEGEGQANYGINYGKLMERILWFREQKVRFADDLMPYAEECLTQIDMAPRDELRIAVLGDASGSMEVAIKSATIIGSLLSAALHADLAFFAEEKFDPPTLPRTAAQVIQVVETVKALGGTSMAAALWPYYHRKIPVDLIVMVSDEGENSRYNGMWFHELFKKYKEEVTPDCQVFLVSFLKVGNEGTIFRRLADSGNEPKQFRFDPDFPDTSKFDSLLGQVTLETGWFVERIEAMEHTVLNVHGCPRAVLDTIMQF